MQTQQIPLRAKDGTIRALATVDSVDYEILSKFNWYLSARGYAARQVKLPGRNSSRMVLMHRQIMMLTSGDGLEVDHLNRIKLDNRRVNLRIVDRLTNERNKVGTQAVSGVRFVHWCKGRQKWMVRMFERGKLIAWAGYFDKLDDAAAAAKDICGKIVDQSLSIRGSPIQKPAEWEIREIQDKKNARLRLVSDPRIIALHTRGMNYPEVAEALNREGIEAFKGKWTRYKTRREINRLREMGKL